MKRRLAIVLALATSLVLLAASAAPADRGGVPQAKFLLFGTAQDDFDPENPANEVISIVNPPAGFGLAYRVVRAPIQTLDNRLNLKVYYAARTCGGGSPRMTLLIDVTGDNRFDIAAHGHVHPPSLAACPPNKWHFEDFTDDQNRWEVTAGAALLPNIPKPYAPWEALETAVATLFPQHEVLSGFVVEDSCSFFVAACGKAYYDLVTISNRTIENHEDAARNPAMSPPPTSP